MYARQTIQLGRLTDLFREREGKKSAEETSGLNHQQDITQKWPVHAHLKGRYNVALGSVALCLGHTVHVEVALE